MQARTLWMCAMVIPFRLVTFSFRVAGALAEMVSHASPLLFFVLTPSAFPLSWRGKSKSASGYSTCMHESECGWGWASRRAWKRREAASHTLHEPMAARAVGQCRATSRAATATARYLAMMMVLSRVGLWSRGVALLAGSHFMGPGVGCE